jgi:plasmid stabilization system protein ParE
MAEIVILQGAQSDLIKITIRYGDRFDSSLDRAFRQLMQFPESAPQYSSEPLTRRILIPNSHLAAFYSVTGDRVLVLAVLDLRQSPEKIEDRLSDP